MGLFAVSRLAARRGIRVRLRAGAPQGLTALVWLPGTLISHEQPQTVGMHSRQQVEGVALADDMIFAEALPAGGDPLQRTSGRHGGRHRLGLLASAGPEEAAPAGRGYAADSGGYASAESGHAAAGNGHAAAGNGHAAAGNGHAAAGNGHAAAGNGHAADGGYSAAGNGRAMAGNGRAPAGGQREQRSVWFAAKTPSSASAQTGGGADEQSPSAAGNGWGQADADWGAGGRLAAGAHYAGAYSAELAARAAGDGQGGQSAPLPQTRAGLPKRVPQANTGSVGQPAAHDASPEDASVLGAPPGTGAPGGQSPFSATGGQRQVTQQAPRRRSPEAARNRVAGFQLGSRDAAQAANGSWSAFSRGDDPPYPPPQPR
jgi:hypothetical protein